MTKNDIFANKYRLTGELGQGGFAKVYKALDTTLDREVAIKILDPLLVRDQTFIKRFRREAKMVARLKHPHIIDVYEIGEHQGRHYIAMPYLAGPNLSDLIRKQGAMPPKQVYRIIKQVGKALDYAHQRGLIHRDIKPPNVLMDENGSAILTDFGIAKAAGESAVLTRSGASIGTPHYMAPEQWQNKPVDHRADLYALGVMLYQMLAGRRPFQGDTSSIMYAHVHEAPPSPLRDNPKLPSQTAPVLQKALAKDPAQRYQSAKALTDDLGRALRGAASVAAPVSKTRILPTPTPPNSGIHTPAKSRTPAPAGASSSTTPLLVGGGIAAALLLAALLFFVLFAGGSEDSPPDSAIQAPPSPAEAAAVAAATYTPVAPVVAAPTSSGAGDSAAAVADTPPPPPSSDETAPALSASGPREAPVLHAPQGAVFAANDPVIFEWSAVPLAPGETFVVSISKDGRLIPLSNANATASRLEIPPGALESGEYAWFVSIMDDRGGIVTRSVSGQFAIKPPPAPAPSAVAAKTPVILVDPYSSTPASGNLQADPTNTSTAGPITFVWHYDQPLAEGQGFEIWVWRNGEPPLGAHDAVQDNLNGAIASDKPERYQLTIEDIGGAAGVGRRGGEYLWAVHLVQITPEYRDLGIQSEPHTLTYVAPGSGGGDNDDDDGGGDGTGGK